jgi:hypothetical protein
MKGIAADEHSRTMCRSRHPTRGKVTDEVVVLEKSGGIAGGAVLRWCRELLVEELLLGGEQAN